MEHSFDKPQKQEKEPFIIKTDKEFHDAFEDTKNQFGLIGLWFKGFTQSLPELQKKNEEIEYKNFKDYLLTDKNSIVAPALMEQEHYTELIKVHDDLIKRIKKFQTIDELKQILEEAHEFLR